MVEPDEFKELVLRVKGILKRKKKIDFFRFRVDNSIQTVYNRMVYKFKTTKEGVII